jgi:predicted HTH transcriptional regulator
MSEVAVLNTETEEKKGAGRPKIELDKDQITRLAEIQCTTKEIAYILGVSVETISRNYSDVVDAGKANGKLALRRAQWRNAVEKDNVTMQIWLGKNILKQTDQPISDEDNQILPWSD